LPSFGKVTNPKGYRRPLTHAMQFRHNQSLRADWDVRFEPVRGLSPMSEMGAVNRVALTARRSLSVFSG
jgi:hypothetical protein